MAAAAAEVVMMRHVVVPVGRFFHCSLIQGPKPYI